jgi:DNA replication licensing factor MCM5
VSTIEAASSGVTDNIHVNPEMRAELQQIEGQIKRKIAINAHKSERVLIDELTKIGANESAVRRALLVMVQRGELEYRKERRVVYRKS